VDDVIFSLNTHPRGPPRLVAVPWVDASEIFGRARAHSLAARKLHKNLERIHRGDGADREIVVDEDMRQALLLILVGIEADGLLLSALVELRKLPARRSSADDGGVGSTRVPLSPLRRRRSRPGRKRPRRRGRESGLSPCLCCLSGVAVRV
jgi:hypothetical protein